MFDSVVKAIEITTASYPHCYIKIWATIHKHNVQDIEKLAELARDLNAGIEYFPISLIKGYNEDVCPDKHDLDKAFGKVMELKQKGLPVRNPWRALKLLKNNSSFKCNFGRIGIHLDHQGNVYSCEDSAGTPRHEWCSYKDFDPDTVFRSAEFKRVAGNLKNCNLCRLPCVMEMSGKLTRCLPEMFFSPARWG